MWHESALTGAACAMVASIQRSDGVGTPEPLRERPELSIVMPCLNEAETLATCIGKAKQFLARHGIPGEVVVGDNGSTDGSQEIARASGARVVDVPLRGYGAALYFACREAYGRYVIMGDADDSYDFSSLMPFVEQLRGGCDLVMGNRFRGGIAQKAMPWKNRYLGNPILSGIGRVLFRCPVGDFHCGLRGFTAEAFARMDLRTVGMEFASEMVIKATLAKMRIAEVPTTLSRDGLSRPPHLRPWRDGWRHLRFMFLFSPRWLFLYPGLALMFVGLIAGALLGSGPRTIGGTVFDVHTLLYAACAVIAGFQAVVFAVLARTFAEAEGLLPQKPALRRWLDRVTLEAGLTLGGLLTLFGLCGSAVAFSSWGAVSFGPLDPTRMLRLVIPSAVGLMLGCEVIFGSLFLSVLKLRVRPLENGKRRETND